MDRDTFRQELESALVQLRDVVQLRVAELGALLLPDVPRSRRGWELSDYLLQAIQRLKPAQSEPDAWPRRRYQLLALRFVNGLSPDEVADRLAISIRHCYRQLARAIDDLAELLWLEVAERTRPHELTPTTGAAHGQMELLQRELAPVLHSGESASLAEAWQSVLGVLAPLLGAGSISLEAELPPDLPRLAASPELLKQLLLGLLGDLLRGGRARAISVIAELSNADVHLLVVARQVSRSGELGEESSSAEVWRRVGQGVSAQLARLHGASLAVLEVEQAGARYRLTLPAVGARTVLIVEDNREVCLLFERYLKSGGYQPLVAPGGAEAIALARSRELYAITLDLVMNHADGWDVLQALRDDPQTSQVPVIVCSVLDHEELALLLGASAFLKKPVMQEQLLQALAGVKEG